MVGQRRNGGELECHGGTADQARVAPDELGADPLPITDDMPRAACAADARCRARRLECWSAEYTIYALVDPRDLTIRYVGCSAGGHYAARDRLQGHVGNARQVLTGKRRGSASDVWAAGVVGAGLRPLMAILEQGYSRKQAASAEVFWIKRLRADGHPLTNASSRGHDMKRRASTRHPWPERTPEQLADLRASVKRRYAEQATVRFRMAATIARAARLAGVQ